MERHTDYPFLLHWVWGHQASIPPINLSTQEKNELFYAAGPVGVCYDWIKNKQFLLLAHKNDIMSIAASPDRKHVVSVDRGEGNVLIIWDADTRKMFHVISDYFPQEGVVKMCFSSDGDQLMTLSGGIPQELCIWYWKHKKTLPDFTFKYKQDVEFQHYLIFHPVFPSHFLTSGSKSVYFFERDKNEIKSAFLNIRNLYNEKVSSQIGIFTQTTFIPKSPLAVTATTKGIMILWGRPLFVKEKPAMDSVEYLVISPKQRVCIRIIQAIESRCSVSFLSSVDNYIIAGTENSELIYYDENFSIQWSKGFNVGHINNVSFHFKQNLEIKGAVRILLAKEEKQQDSPFESTDFIVCTVEGYVGCYTSETKLLEQILWGTNHLIKSVAVHPEWPYVYFGDYNGTLQKWNYTSKELINKQVYESSCSKIELLAIDNKGAYTACIMLNGNLAIFDAVCFSSKPCFTATQVHHRPTSMLFSPDSQHLLITDTSSYVIHYRLHLLVVPAYQLITKEISAEEPLWTYGGKSRQHMGRIVDCMFNDPEKNEPLFFYTLGEDRFMVQYNISSSKGVDLDVSKRIVLERKPVPLCMTWYPVYNASNLVAILNDDGKMRIYCIETEKTVRLVCLPLYEEQIKRIILQKKLKCLLKEEFPHCDNENDIFQYFVFNCTHMIGLSKFPIDGNPNISLGLTSTPSGVKFIVPNKEQTFLFTSGLSDSWIFMYEINIMAVLESEKEGGEGIDAFRYLFPSNCDPDEMIKKLLYSVYSLELEKKMLKLGKDLPILLGEIPIDFLHYVLAAIGCFVTPNDLQLMFRDIEFESKYLYNGEKRTLSCLDIVKLYVNYRPTEPVTRSKLKQVFNDILALEEDPDQMNRARFIDLLTTRGDALSHSELLKILRCLKNIEKEPENYLSDDDDETDLKGDKEIGQAKTVEFGSETELDKLIPEYVTEDAFFKDIFCLGEADEDLSKYALKEADYRRVQEYPKFEDFVAALQSE